MMNTERINQIRERIYQQIAEAQTINHHNPAQLDYTFRGQLSHLEYAIADGRAVEFEDCERRLAQMDIHLEELKAVFGVKEVEVPVITPTLDEKVTWEAAFIEADIRTERETHNSKPSTRTDWLGIANDLARFRLKPLTDAQHLDRVARMSIYRIRNNA